MDRAEARKVSLAADFIDSRAPEFHHAFGAGSVLDTETMAYKPDATEHVLDLKETLECHQNTASSLVDFTDDLHSCTWDDVHRELEKALKAEVESEQRGRNPARKAWRKMGTTVSILTPGLSAIPDDFCVLHGGLAVIFSLARHSQLNRIKILTAMERVPNIIEEARNKSHLFPVDHDQPRTVKLDNQIQALRIVLVRTLPALINILIPNTFRNIWKSPFRGWKIDKLLDEIAVCAEAVRVAAEALRDDIIADTHKSSKKIEQQLAEVIRKHEVLQMAIESAHSKTNLLNFLVEQISYNPGMGGMIAAAGGMGDDMPNRVTAIHGYTARDILQLIKVDHLRVSNDAARIVRSSPTLPQADVERCALVMAAPEIKHLLNSSCGPEPGVVVIDGHFDRSQMGKISPLSYVCVMLAQAIRSQSLAPSAPTSPLYEKQQPPMIRRNNAIILEFYCSLHAGAVEDDDLAGPQGLMRCLTTELMLGMVANDIIGHSDVDITPLPLQHLGDGEEDLLIQKDLGALCRLFVELVRLVPPETPIYCLVDGWSAYERDLWEAEYAAILDAFRDAAAGASFKLLLTSPASCRWLGDFILPGQRVSLRNKEVNGGRDWWGAGRGGLRGIARAATMTDTAGGFGGRYYDDYYSQGGVADDEHDRRSSQ